MNRVVEESRPRSALVVVSLGARFLFELARGKNWGDRSPRAIGRALLSAARPHFFVFPAATALVGAAAVPGERAGWRVVLAALAMALSWSVGQLLNDIQDVDADLVDAPNRPIASGRVTSAEAAATALVIGVSVAVATCFVHPAAWALLIASAILLAAYAPAKGVPALGNLAHGALVMLVALIGTASRMPEAPLRDVLATGWMSALAAAALAALYLESNYEKDRVGDSLGGYLTLAHVLGLRGSALLRGAGIAAVFVFAYHAGLLAPRLALALYGVGAASSLISVLFVLAGGTERSALAGYRFAIHGTSASLLGLASPLLGPGGALAILAASVLLVERKFRSSENP